MRKKAGSLNRSQFSQMAGMKMEKQYMIHLGRLMILKIKKTLNNIVFRHLMKTAIRKQEYGKVREQNISGNVSPFRQMTGMNIVNLKNGENPGLSTATGIFHQNYISITGLMKDRGLI